MQAEISVAGRRFQTSIQMSPGARDIWFDLKKRLGVSRTDILEMAIRELADTYLTPEKMEKIVSDVDRRQKARQKAEAV